MSRRSISLLRGGGVVLWPITPSLEIPAVFSCALAKEKMKALDPRQLFSQGTLKYDRQGHAVAGILGENIYVLFDLLGQPEELVPLMLRRTLDLCLEGLTESLSHWNGRLPHQLEVTLNRLSHSTTLASLDHSSPWKGPGTQDPHHREAGAPDDVFQRQTAAVAENLKELSRQMGRAIHRAA
jgi:hypothetical protein